MHSNLPLLSSLVQDVDAKVSGGHLLASTVIQHTVKPEASVFKVSVCRLYYPAELRLTASLNVLA